VSTAVITDLAYEDMEQAVEYLDGETGQKDAGNRWLDRLHQAFARLAAAPSIGRLRMDIEPGLRSYIFEQYTIFYYVYPKQIEISRVLHQRRNFRKEFGIE